MNLSTVAAYLPDGFTVRRTESNGWTTVGTYRSKGVWFGKRVESDDPMEVVEAVAYVRARLESAPVSADTRTVRRTGRPRRGRRHTTRRGKGRTS